MAKARKKRAAPQNPAENHEARRGNARTPPAPGTRRRISPRSPAAQRHRQDSPRRDAPGSGRPVEGEPSSGPRLSFLEGPRPRAMISRRVP